MPASGSRFHAVPKISDHPRVLPLECRSALSAPRMRADFFTVLPRVKSPGQTSS
jgi:hypothetical protein